jgi:hypothetical protein
VWVGWLPPRAVGSRRPQQHAGSESSDIGKFEPQTICLMATVQRALSYVCRGSCSRQESGRRMGYAACAGHACRIGLCMSRAYCNVSQAVSNSARC